MPDEREKDAGREGILTAYGIKRTSGIEWRNGYVEKESCAIGFIIHGSNFFAGKCVWR